MGLFDKLFFGNNPKINEAKLKAAVNAVLANHLIMTDNSQLLKKIATEAAVKLGANINVAPSMQNATADLTYIPRSTQMQFIAGVCLYKNIPPAINGMSWYVADKVEELRDQNIINALSAVKKYFAGELLYWDRDSVDFQALYYRGENITYGYSGRPPLFPEK